jgi:hypothetical protein
MSTQLIVASDDDNSPSLRVTTFLNTPTSPKVSSFYLLSLKSVY